MRVLLTTIGRYPHIGGKSSHMAMVARGLAALGADVRVLSASSVPYAGLISFSDGPRVILDGISKGCGLLHSYKVRARMIADAAHKAYGGGPDIIHAHDAPAVEIGCHLRGRYGWMGPTLLTVHGDAANEYASEGKAKVGGRAYELLFEQERRAYLKAAKVIAVDSRLKDHIASVSGRDDAAVFPNFVDTDAFSPSDPCRRAADRLKVLERICSQTGESLDVLERASDLRLILCARRLVPKNGVDVAIRAVSGGALAGLDCRLLCAGDGSQRPALEQMRRESGLGGKVLFLGNVRNEDLAPLYRGCDCSVVPSVSSFGVVEATSIAALEAMACGKPVLCSSIGGLAELVDHGYTGILFPEGDPQALANELHTVLTKADYAYVLGEGARKAVLLRHSYLSACRDLLDIYGSVLNTASTER